MQTRPLPRDISVDIYQVIYICVEAVLLSGVVSSAVSEAFFICARCMMQIFFVFNTSYCKSDEDDPKDAIMYFYPLEACDAQKYELCFQLVGMSQFLKSTFTSPVVVTLDQGKFAFCLSQNYLLVLGGSNAVSSTILKEQLLYLHGVFAFHFKDINSVLNVCGNNRSLFLQEMKQVWDHIILTSKFFGNAMPMICSAVPVTTVSQKNSDLQCRAKKLLHMCQRNPPVIAGAVFCEELLMYSQLTAELTKNLMLLLNFPDCAILQNAQITYKLPPGVKMKSVYLTQKELSNVLKHNHLSVGSQIRYHSPKKMPVSVCALTSLSSGSEGDVDSGNSSESTEVQKSDASAHSSADSRSKSKAERKLSANSESSTPRSCDLPRPNKVLDKKLERHLSTDTEKSYSTAYESASGSIFDHCRRYNQYFSPTDDSSWKHTVLQRRHSFSCSLNTIPARSQFKVKSSYCDSDLHLHTSLFRTIENMDRWDLSMSESKNFEDGPHFNREVLHTVHNLLTVSCFLCLIKNHNLAAELLHKGIKKKMQVLKCRLNKRRHKSYSHVPQTSKSSADSSSQSAFCPNTRTNRDVKRKNSSHVEDLMISKLNSYERQEMFLYTQRYCGCTLFVLLNSSFDEDLLSALWMYGFPDLGKIELEFKKYKIAGNKAKRNDFHVYIFDNDRQELSGEMPHTRSGSVDSIVDAAIQMMHVDFQSNASLRSVSLTSQNRSIVGYSVPQNEIYYLQPGTINESFTHFHRKAQHRIKKYFGISIADS